MKVLNIILLIVAGYGQMIVGQSMNDVLLTVGEAEVTVGEFKYIYDKNNGENADYSKASLEEYLGLYEKFKLKVQKAKAMQLDTIEVLKEELAGYRKQLASSFLADKEVLGFVIDEVHERKKQDIEVQHILIKLKMTAPDTKKKEAEERIREVKRQVDNGVPFGDLVVKYSEDRNTVRRKGNLGYTSAMLPSGFYDFENALYNNKVGSVVGPVWSKLGCHLLKIKDKRPARGVRRVAHILIKAKNKSPFAINNAKKQADSIRTAILGGAKWEAMVASHSADKKTLKTGGELPIFGISTYESAFEDASFGLSKVGEISEPTVTNGGIHLIKLLEKVSPETKDEIKKRLKNKIKKYDRYKTVELDLIEKIKKNSYFSENKNVLSEFVKSLTKDFYSYKWKPTIQDEKILLSMGGEDVSLAEFEIFCKKNTRMRGQFDKNKPLDEGVGFMYKEFVREKAIGIEEKNLEKKYPAFKSLMREYEEGILLFEATKLSVWDKANRDTVGLESFYQEHRERYKYDKRVKVGMYIVNTGNEKILKKIMKCARKNDSEKTLQKFNKEDEVVVTYEEATMDMSDSRLKNMTIKKDNLSSPVKGSKKETFSFSKIINIEEARAKTLKEARGYIVADYQDKLEKDWIEKLRKEYKVVLHKKVYEQLIK